MAAAAKVTGPADARIPCPLCGGLIHPIAGRCKHCKGDLSATRSARPAAAASLPQLAPTAAHATNGHTNGHAPSAYAVKAHPANAHMAVPIAMRVDEASQPILPPRPTGRMEATGTAAQPTSWKSWPMIVIGIAVIAIIAAVILMVWPGGGSTKADAKTLAPPPAPERMDTNPLPNNGPSGQIDPWKTNPDPDPPKQPDPPRVDPNDPNDPNDPGGLSAPFRGGGTFGSSQNMLGMMGGIMKHACDRLATCPNPDPMVRSACETSLNMMPPGLTPTCSAAQRCFSKIDQLPCDDIDPSVTMGMAQGIQDCLDAMRC